MNLWNSIMRIGCFPNVTGLEKGRIMMLNGVMAITSLSVIVFSVVYAAIGYRYFYGPLYTLPVTGLVFVSNFQAHHARARNIYLFGSLLVICYWCYEGRGNGNEYTFIGLATTSTLLHKKKAVVFSINLACASLFVLYKYLDSTIPFTPDPVINYHVVPWIILLNTVGVITFQVVFFRDLAHHYDRKLSGKYKEQVALLEQQKVVEEELKTSNDKLQDITQHLEWKVKQKTVELQTYIEAVNINTFATLSDLGGCFTEVNDLVVETSGYSREELIGKHFSLLASGRHPEEFFLERRKLLMQGNTWRGEVEHKTRNGALLWFDCVVIPMRKPHGTIDSFLTLGLPITERKQNEKMKEGTHRLLENIAFRASHKIRGPLARIKGLSDLVKRDLLNQDEFKMVAGKLAICCEELNVATSELVSFVHDHQEMINEDTPDLAIKPPTSDDCQGFVVIASEK